MLQDVNWPGALEGMDVLRDADRVVVVSILEVAIEEALNTNDECWLGWIKQFLDFAEMGRSDFAIKELYDSIEHIEW
ncbi:MAG: DUF5071 domain-containing protein [Defluviitaleaceae bacterium]|nr:DUF5071 domain-containing protein [Defluviitaleaceae bacterium]